MRPLNIKNKLISMVIVRIFPKGYTLDPALPLNYLLFFILEKLMDYIRGLFYFRKRNIFVGKHVSLISKNNIHISGTVKLSDYVYINALSKEGLRLGNGVNLGKYCRIECTGSLANLGVGVVLEDGVGLNSNCFIGGAGGVYIAKDTIVGELVTFHSENHNFHSHETPIKLQGVSRKGISIGMGCWIGAKATILDGATIGDGCVIAAGAVVTKGNYKANSIYAGVPAKFVKERES